MLKYEFKQLLIVIIFSIINLCISYFITITFGIQNTFFYNSLSITVGDVSYETLIFMLFSLAESTAYHFKFECKKK